MTSPYSLAPVGISSMRMSQNASRASSVSRPSTRNSYSFATMASLLSPGSPALAVRQSGRTVIPRLAWPAVDMGQNSGSGLGGALRLDLLRARPGSGPPQLELQFDL